MNLKGIKINVLGDSITQGVGASCIEKCFVNVLAAKTGATVNNYGISGTRIARQKLDIPAPHFNTPYCDRIPEMDKDADVVLIFGGTNDFGHGDAPFGEYMSDDEWTFCGAFNMLMKKLFVAFPDSEIVWTNRDGHVEFVGGNTGRSVHVRGVSLGDAELEVIIGGRTRQAPTFPLKVVTPQTFKITAWIVEDAQYNQRPIEPAEVQNMIAPLNDIYRQVGVSFYLDSVTVTNIPAACNLLYDSTTNDVWNYDRLVTVVGHDTGGIECYFVNDIVRLDGKPGPLASNCDFGLVLTPDAPVVTLAHEIGHAFGLKDVYASNREKDSSIPPADVLKVYDELDAGHDEKIHFASCIDDWNGGCQGCGNGGERYYLPDTTLRDVLHRLVMYGVDQKDGNQRDITIGSVRGVWYTKHDGIRYWHLSDAPVGFFSNLYKKASPAHQ